MVRVALIGAVNSTLATLNKMIHHNVNLVCVLGYKPKVNEIVSGAANLEDISVANDIQFQSFSKINTPENIEYLKSKDLDVIFVVGLSQLVGDEILNIPKLGCIGFHPTLLPKGRGRAPLAWLVLENEAGAANFFLMGKGADEGPIFVQEPFELTEDDDASSVEVKIIEAIDKALDIFLPDLKSGVWNPILQDDRLATYYEKRTPVDGWIDWHLSAQKVNRLIKASAHPHPKAYTYLNDSMITINNSRIEPESKIKGVIGRVLRIVKKEALVQCGEGLVWISNIEDELGQYSLKVGQRLGYYCEMEIFLLKKELKIIKEILNK